MNRGYKKLSLGVSSVFIFANIIAFAQVDSVKRSDVIRFADGVFHNLTSPVKWKKNEWLNLTGVLGSVAIISSFDQPVQQFWLKQEHNPGLNAINNIGYSYGKPYSALIFSGSFYATGLLFKNEWAKETGLILGTALLTSGLIEATLKPLIGRARPEHQEGNYDFHPFEEEAEFHSLPSGHSAIAFTISFVMARRVNNIPLRIFFYSLATTTAFCRLYSNAHWLSDVALGGAVAWYSTIGTFNRLHSNKLKLNQKIAWKISPYPGGLTLTGNFINE